MNRRSGYDCSVKGIALKSVWKLVRFGGDFWSQLQDPKVTAQAHREKLVQSAVQLHPAQAVQNGRFQRADAAQTLWLGSRQQVPHPLG